MFDRPQRRYYVNTVSVKNAQSISRSRFKNSTLSQRDAKNEINFDKEKEERQKKKTQSALPFISF